MTARLHPGAVVHIWDHLVIGLADGDGQTALLSLYAIAWSPELGAGHVCLVDRRGLPRMVLADPVVLGERMQARLRAMDAPGPADRVPVTAAAFERHAAEATGLGWTIRTETSTIEARWQDLGSPVWVEGPAPAFRAEEDIWACFVPAASASIVIDGVRLGGRPFEDRSWLPKLGRALSSAHAALAEVRVTPASAVHARGD